MAFGIGLQRKILQRFYEDRATLLQPKEHRQGALTWAEYVVAEENVPCSLSRLGSRSNRVGNRSARGDDVQHIAWDCVLFLAPEWWMEAGDRVRVSQLGKVMEFEVMGRPAQYATHQELLLREVGKA